MFVASKPVYKFGVIQSGLKEKAFIFEFLFVSVVLLLRDLVAF